MNIEMSNIPVEPHACSRGKCEATSNVSLAEPVRTPWPHHPPSAGSAATSDTEVALDRNNQAIPVVGARSDGTGLLHYVPNTGMASDQAFVETCIDLFGVGRVWAFLNALILMREQAFFTADVSPLPTSDADEGTMLVDRSTPALDMLYTRALRKPVVVRSRTDFVGQGSTRTPLRGIPHKGPQARAVVIGWRNVKSHIAYLVALLVLLSVGLGVLVGLATRNVEWGLGVTGTSVGILAVLEGLVVWLFR